LEYQTGLAFALLEAGHESQALELTEKMERDTPLVTGCLVIPKHYLTLIILMRCFLKHTLCVYGLLKTARQNLAEASALAPSNVNLRVALADAQRMSNLPRHAEHNLK